MFKTVKSITRVQFLLLFVFVTYVHIFYVKTYGNGKAEMVYKIILNNIQKSVVGNVVSDIRIGHGKNKAGDGFMDFGSIIASCENEINDMLGDVIPSTTTIESLSRENHPKRVVEINNICDKLNSKFFKDEEGSIGASYFNSLLEGKKDHNSQHYYVAIIQENNYDFSFFTYYFTPYVLSSLLIKKWWLSNYSDNKDLFPKIKGGHLKTIPIPDVHLDAQQPFIALADTMLSLNKQLQEKRSRFLRRLSENFEGVKITTAMQTFDQMEFKAFVAELKKQKINLSLAQQDEWEDYFNQYRNDCQQLSEQIAQTDREIDQRVYQLYGLTEEEIKIVEGTN